MKVPGHSYGHGTEWPPGGHLATFDVMAWLRIAANLLAIFALPPVPDIRHKTLLLFPGRDRRGSSYLDPERRRGDPQDVESWVRPVTGTYSDILVLTAQWSHISLHAQHYFESLLIFLFVFLSAFVPSTHSSFFQAASFLTSVYHCRYAVRAFLYDKGIDLIYQPLFV